MWSIVAVFAAACIGSTVAPAPCVKYPDILKHLKEYPECYENGNPPENLVGYNIQSTVKYISDDVLPKETKCVTGRQVQGKGLVDLIFDSGSSLQMTYEQTVHSQEHYILEKDPKEILYKIWPIRNKNHVYFYYRCIETAGVEEEGKLMAAIYVDCGHMQEAEEEIKKAKQCAEKLKITLVEKTPCDC